MEIPASEFESLYWNLFRYPLALNAYRRKAGTGRSQTFGVVNRRCLPPDYSRQNWLRPYTLKLLQEFAAAHVPIPWNAVTVNVNYQAAAHRDKHNIGPSFLVAFGDYEGGALEMLEGEKQGLHDVKHKPLIHDFSKDLHCVKPWEGTRMSLVFYTYDLKGVELPPCSIRYEDGEYRFYRGEEHITVKEGLPHPLRKSKGTTG